MKNKSLRAEAWHTCKQLKSKFKESGDRKGEHFFATVELFLTMDELSLSKFLSLSMAFAKDELARLKANQN